MREVCGERVITGEGLEAINFGKLLALNETAAYLWQQATKQGDFTVESLAEKLCEDYEVNQEASVADVNDIIKAWQDVGVVETA